jgi:hypothetical protein
MNTTILQFSFEEVVPVTTIDEQLDDLYAAYCEFINDSTRAISAKIYDPQIRENICKLNRALPKSEFCRRVLAQSSIDPDGFEGFRERIEKGWIAGSLEPQSGRRR